MSAHDDEQRAARSRAANTGENYTAALRRIRGEGIPPESGWSWPETVIPADLHPGTVDPTGVVEIGWAPINWSCFDPEKTIVEPGLLKASYADDLAGQFRSSKPATGLLRLRLAKIVAAGRRGACRLHHPDSAEFDNDYGAWNPLDAMIWQRPDAEDYALAVAHVEEAMRRSAPGEGFDGVLDYEDFDNRPIHRALFGLAECLLGARRYDEAAVIIENHLWLWPGRFVYTEIQWSLLAALRVSGGQET